MADICTIKIFNRDGDSHECSQSMPCPSHGMRSRCCDIVDAVRKTLPPETDAGVYYDNRRKLADGIREAIARETDHSVVLLLRRELQMAENVGD